MRWSTTSLAVACLLTLGACAEGALDPPDYRGSNPSAISGAAAEGGMHVQIAGNPFETNPEVLDDVVSRGLEASHFGPRVAFYTTLPEDVKGTYRVRMIFDAPINLGGRELCGEFYDEISKAEIDPGSGRMVAAFCMGRQYQATLRGTPPRTNSPEDPAFRKFISQTGLTLFPPPSLLQQERGGRNAIIF
jgi:hypothetical protein